jgi:hypothetical protein
VPDGGLVPEQTDRPTVSRKIPLTLTLTLSWLMSGWTNPSGGVKIWRSEEEKFFLPLDGFEQIRDKMRL